LNIGPVLHHPHIRNSIDPADGVVDHQLRLDLAPVLDQHQNTDHRVVCDADVAVDVTHLPEAAFGHAADMAARLEGSVDPVLVPVLRREVRRCELNQVPVLNKETKICLLMTDKAKLVAAHVNGAPLHSNFPEKGATENNHHGVMGRRSQPNWGVVTALLQGEPDEEPWISASGLDEGVGQAPAGLHVH
jgi:hypothetical protein